MAKSANFESRYAAPTVESDGKTYELVEVTVGLGNYSVAYGNYSSGDFVCVKLKKRRGASHAYAFYTPKKTAKKSSSGKKSSGSKSKK